MLKLGLPCIYRPRVPYGRQSELFCFITRVISDADSLVDLIAFPANSEPLHVNNVMRRTEAVNIHCWEPTDDAKLQDVATEIVALRKQYHDLWKFEARLVALEKRAPRSGQS